MFFSGANVHEYIKMENNLAGLRKIARFVCVHNLAKLKPILMCFGIQPSVDFIYVNSVLFGCPQEHTARLPRAQHALARA